MVAAAAASSRSTDASLHRRRARHAAPPVNEGTLTHGARLRLHDVLLGPCPSWVKHVILRLRRSLPVFADKRTITEAAGTSDFTHVAAGFFIRPLPRHSVHFGG